MWAGQVLLLMVVTMVSLCVARAWARYNPYYMNHNLRQPRCSASNKPCRTRAVMRADFLPMGSREINSPPSCSCPPSSPCYDDWDRYPERVITRELHTNGNISMTFSMMYCGVVQPRERCTPGQIALQLSGWTPMPTEIDYIQCSCPAHRPLVLHTISTGSDHRQYHAYVCFQHKSRCKRRRSSQRRRPLRDVCMETDPVTHTVTYPCRCSSSTSCQEERFNSTVRYVCKRPRSG